MPELLTTEEDARKVISAMLYRAVKDARYDPTTADKREKKKSAVIWLGSSAAATWTFQLSLDHERMLRNMDWVSEAEEVLAMHVSGRWPAFHLEQEEAELLRDVLKHLLPEGEVPGVAYAAVRR